MAIVMVSYNKKLVTLRNKFRGFSVGIKDGLNEE